MKKKKDGKINLSIKGSVPDCSKGSYSSYNGSCGGMGYVLGFIGSAIYYVSTASGFWNGALGLLKSLVWPAFLVFELLKFVGA